MTMNNTREWIWVLTASVLILALGSFPTWQGYRAQTPELRFRGLYYDSQDYAAHIAMMEAGAHGEWTYQFRFTAEPMRSAYVRLFYILLGHVSKWMGLSSELTFELARWGLGIAALLALHRLMRQLFQNPVWVRVAFLLAALGSGLGWLQLIFGWTSTRITPIDFWLIDAYVFFSLSVFPHFAFVTAGMCLSLSLWLRYLETPNGTNIFWIVLIIILVQFTNPIAFAVIDAAFAGSVAVAWWKTGRLNRAHMVGLAVLAIAQIPILAYNVLAFRHDPLWSQYTSQHQTLSPPLDYYLWGFAPFLPFAILGTVSAVREKAVDVGAFVFWIVAAFALAYAPLYTQQRFLQNVTIPLAVLATRGWITLFESWGRPGSRWMRWRQSLVMLFVFLAAISSIQLSVGRAAYLQTYPAQFFYPASLDQAANWLREHAQYNDVLLAAEPTSQVLAQKAGVRVYGGHEMETLNYPKKQSNIEAFFRGDLPTLASPPVRWVIFGPYEQEISPVFLATDSLELVYENSELKIYQVK